MNRLILVRHGETAWNADKVLQGQTDIELSPRGREQAKALIPLVRRWQPDFVLASDLLRARQTAALMGWPDVATDGRWREANLGEWSGKRVEDLKRTDAARYQRWRDGVEAPPAGEAMSDFRARVASAFDGVRSRKGNVLVVTHGGVIRALLSLCIGPSHTTIAPSKSKRSPQTERVDSKQVVKSNNLITRRYR
jgi:glucosyl-3-phosphoglycerate phosphatase